MTSSVGENQWQLSLLADLTQPELEQTFQNKIPIWTGLFCTLKLPEGNTKQDVSHSVWVSAIGASGHFYQIGFNESGLSQDSSTGHQTRWTAFDASTQNLHLDDFYNVVIYNTDRAGRAVLASPGETYSLYIETANGFMTMSIWNSNDQVVWKRQRPEKNCVLGGTVSPRVSFTLEGYKDFTEDDIGDLGPFTISEFLLQGDFNDYTPQQIRPEINFHDYPAFYGVQRTGEREIKIGRGLPHLRFGSI